MLEGVLEGVLEEVREESVYVVPLSAHLHYGNECITPPLNQAKDREKVWRIHVVV